MFKKLFILLVLLLSVMSISSQDTCIWNPTVSNDWEWMGNWEDGVVPSENSYVIFNNSYADISTKVSIGYIILNPSTAIIINRKAGFYADTIVVVSTTDYNSGEILENGGRIDKKSTFIIQKQFKSNTWYHFSPPLDNISASLITNNIYHYDEQSIIDDWNLGWVIDTGTLSKGVGYALLKKNTKIINMVGAFSQKSVTKNMNHSNNSEVLEHRGWSLISNPFLATINWDNVNYGNISTSIILWNSETNDYMYYMNGVSTNGGSKYIKPGQSFWVRVENIGTGWLTFSDDQIEVLGYNQQITLKSTPNDENIYIELSDLYNDKDNLAITFNDTATLGYDNGIEAVKFDKQGINLYYKFDSLKASITTVNYTDTIIDIYAYVPSTNTYFINVNYYTNLWIGVNDIIIKNNGYIKLDSGENKLILYLNEPEFDTVIADTVIADTVIADTVIIDTIVVDSITSNKLIRIITPDEKYYVYNILGKYLGYMKISDIKDIRKTKHEIFIIIDQSLTSRLISFDQ